MASAVSVDHHVEAPGRTPRGISSSVGRCFEERVGIDVVPRASGRCELRSGTHLTEAERPSSRELGMENCLYPSFYVVLLLPRWVYAVSLEDGEPRTQLSPLLSGARGCILLP